MQKKQTKKAKAAAKKRQTRLKQLAVVIVVLLSLAITANEYFELGILPSWSDIYSTAGVAADTSSFDGITVSYLDVGQGDSTLIVADGAAMLIDGSTAEYGAKIIDYIKGQGISKLDYIIATHPHADHIGGLESVLDEFEVDNVIMPKLAPSAVPTTRTYEDFLLAVGRSGAKASYAKPGTVLELGNGEAQIIAPINYSGRDLNAYSVALRLVYGNVSFMFTGDCEEPGETDIIKSAVPIQADVLKCGHHGSSTSSSSSFLAAVNPSYAVVSCGSGNSYGHPHTETIERLDALQVVYYRTDLNGTVVCTSDGNELSFKTQRG